MVAAAPGPVAQATLCRIGAALGFALRLLLASALGAWPAGAQAAPTAAVPGQTPGQYAQPPVPPWQFRPAPPTNARGAPPGYLIPGPVPGTGGSYQSAWPGGTAPPPGLTPNAPLPARLEWSIDETEPLVQQGLLLRLRLISSEALTTADPDLAAGNEILMQAIGSPTASTRNAGDGRRELVTQFSIILTPLRPGNLELPSLRVTGTRPGRFGKAERYEAVAISPLRLRVRPAMAAVTPWLPLRALGISAILDHPERVEPGQPVTLTLTVVAEGALAAQLPDLEEQLVSPDFRIYRERTLTDNRLSQDGRQLTAKRTEIYTLVPLGSGTLRLPEIKIPWWNLETSSRQVATLPIKTLRVEGAAGPFGLAASWSDLGSGWSKVWLPITAVLLVIAGYWGAVLLHRKGPDTAPARRQRPRRGPRPAIGALGRRAARAMARLNPAPLAARARTTAMRLDARQQPAAYGASGTPTGPPTPAPGASASNTPHGVCYAHPGSAASRT